MCAKTALIDSIDKLDLGHWPKPARRRNSNELAANKLKQDVDDIFNMLTYIDEQNLSNRLPQYVVANTDLIPSSNLTEGDMYTIMNKLTVLDLQLQTIHDLTDKHVQTQTKEHNSIVEDIRTARPRLVPAKSGLQTIANIRLSHLAKDRIASTSEDNSGGEMAGNSDRQGAWETLPPPSPSASAPVDDFHEIISKKKRKRLLTAEARLQNQIMESDSDAPTFPQTLLSVNSRGKDSSNAGNNARRGDARRVGVSTNTSTLLSAASDLTKKKVFV